MPRQSEVAGDNAAIENFASWLPVDSSRLLVGQAADLTTMLEFSKEIFERNPGPV